jgi:hypothetical protein
VRAHGGQFLSLFRCKDAVDGGPRRVHQRPHLRIHRVGQRAAEAHLARHDGVDLRHLGGREAELRGECVLHPIGWRATPLETRPLIRPRARGAVAQEAAIHGHAEHEPRDEGEGDHQRGHEPTAAGSCQGGPAWVGHRPFTRAENRESGVTTPPSDRVVVGDSNITASTPSVLATSVVPV